MVKRWSEKMEREGRDEGEAGNRKKSDVGRKGFTLLR